MTNQGPDKQRFQDLHMEGLLAAERHSRFETQNSFDPHPLTKGRASHDEIAAYQNAAKKVAMASQCRRFSIRNRSHIMSAQETGIIVKEFTNSHDTWKLQYSTGLLTKNHQDIETSFLSLFKEKVIESYDDLANNKAAFKAF